MRALVARSDAVPAGPVPPPSYQPDQLGSWRWVSSISPRQLEVLRLRALGWTVSNVTEHMGIARDTYYNHRAAALGRLGVLSEAEAWTKLGWLVVPEA